jgi:hypothetical protein
MCLLVCFCQGFSYSGNQNGGDCYCGNSYGSYGMSTGCTSGCNGDSGTICGGASSISANSIAFTGLRKTFSAILCATTEFLHSIHAHVVSTLWNVI